MYVLLFYFLLIKLYQRKCEKNLKYEFIVTWENFFLFCDEYLFLFFSVEAFEII